MDFIPYKVNEVLENVFYQIPKELFTNPVYNNLDSNSILLYGLLLDRLSVSMKNKWIDKEGNIYLIYSRKEAQKMLKLSDKPVSKAFKKLEEAKLIYEIRSGFKKHNIIYVGKIVHQSVEKTMNRIMYDVVIINIIKIIIVKRDSLKKVDGIMSKEHTLQKNLNLYTVIYRKENEFYEK